jgi:type IV pilus assembly protein PilM
MRLFGRPKQTVGLDIGSGLVKAVVVEHGGGGMPELVRAVVTPLADDAIVEGEVMDSAPVAAAVRETLAAAGESRGRLVVAVGGRDVIVKRIRAARAQGAEARALLRWEAEQHVPFDMNSVALDFHVLDPEGSGPEMTVLLAAAKREVVDAKLRLLDDAGAVPRVVDVRRSRCTTRSARPARSAARRRRARGARERGARGHHGERARGRRAGADARPGVGVRRVREDLQRELALSAAAADALLRGERQSPQVVPIVARHAEELADGVERAVAQLASIAPDAGPLRALFLCGGGARVPGSPPRPRRGCACGSSRPTRWPACTCATARSTGSTPKASRRSSCCRWGSPCGRSPDAPPRASPRSSLVAR